MFVLTSSQAPPPLPQSPSLSLRSAAAMPCRLRRPTAPPCRVSVKLRRGHVVSSPSRYVAAMPRLRRAPLPPCRVVSVYLRRLHAASPSTYAAAMPRRCRQTPSPPCFVVVTPLVCHVQLSSVVMDYNFTHMNKGETNQDFHPTK